MKSPKLSACTVIACAVLLFIPENLVPNSAITVFRQKYGTFILIAMAFGSAALVVEVFYWGIQRLIGRRRRLVSEQQLLERMLECLSRLDKHEQLVMREFIIQERNTIKLPLNQAVVVGLRQAGIINLVQPLIQRCHAGQVGIFTLSPVIRDYLSPELVGLPNGPVTDQDRERVFGERPYYIHEITQRERVWES